jgi:hypothetical protein
MVKVAQTKIIYTQAKKKKKKQAIFTVLGHVVEAQHLPKTLPT